MLGVDLTSPPLPAAHRAECWSSVPGRGGLSWEGLRHLWPWRDEWGSSQGRSHCGVHRSDSRGELARVSAFLPPSFLLPPIQTHRAAQTHSSLSPLLPPASLASPTKPCLISLGGSPDFKMAVVLHGQHPLTAHP
jgi:hypothetical protein